MIPVQRGNTRANFLVCNDRMQIWYFLNYVELSYSEITFIFHTFNHESSAIPNFFHFDIID